MLLRQGLARVSVAEALDFARADTRFIRPFPESRFLATREAMQQEADMLKVALSFCNWKQRQPVARELKQIYEAETAELAAKRLEDFAGTKDTKQFWRRERERSLEILYCEIIEVGDLAFRFPARRRPSGKRRLYFHRQLPA